MAVGGRISTNSKDNGISGLVFQTRDFTGNSTAKSEESIYPKSQNRDMEHPVITFRIGPGKRRRV